MLKNMREARRVTGISIPRLAEMADMDTRSLYLIEACRRDPSTRIAKKIAVALGYTIDDLVGDQDDDA